MLTFDVEKDKIEGLKVEAPPARKAAGQEGRSGQEAGLARLRGPSPALLPSRVRGAAAAHPVILYPFRLSLRPFRWR